MKLYRKKYIKKVVQRDFESCMKKHFTRYWQRMALTANKIVKVVRIAGFYT